MPPVTPERVVGEHEIEPGELGDEALGWPDTSEELDGGAPVGTCGLVGVVVVDASELRSPHLALGAGGDDDRVLDVDVLPLAGTCGLEASNENAADPRFRFEDCAPNEFFKGLGVQLELGLENKLGPHGLFALIKLSQTLDRELSTLLPLLSSSSSSELNMLWVFVGMKSLRVTG